jgi:antitoxin MazE
MGIRIPKELLREAGMQKDDDLDISLVDGALLLRKVHRHKSLEERARECNGKVGPYTEFNWGTPSEERYGSDNS